MKGKGEKTFLTYFWSNTRPNPNGSLSVREGRILGASIKTGGQALAWNLDLEVEVQLLFLFLQSMIFRG